MELATCPFCSPPTEKIVAQSSKVFAFRDAYPITSGHTLVIPKQHVASIFDLSETDRAQLWQLVVQVRADLAEQFANWAYQQTFDVGGLTWTRKEDMVALPMDWQRSLDELLDS